MKPQPPNARSAGETRMLFLLLFLLDIVLCVVLTRAAVQSMMGEHVFQRSRKSRLYTIPLSRDVKHGAIYTIPLDQHQLETLNSGRFSHYTMLCQDDKRNEAPIICGNDISVEGLSCSLNFPPGNIQIIPTTAGVKEKFHDREIECFLVWTTY